MYIRKFLSVLLLLPVQPIFAQQDTVTKYVDYYDKPDESVRPVYYLKVYKQNPSDILYKRQKRYAFDHKLVADGWSKDAAGEIKQGVTIVYSISGTINDSGRYENNKKEGTWIGYFLNGSMEHKYNYHNGTLVNTGSSWYKNGLISDSVVLDNNGMGTGYGFYDNGRKSYEGKYNTGMKNGTWTYFYNEPGDHKSMEVIFAADTSQNWKCFTIDGAIQNKNCFFEREAIFPGGDKVFVNYLGEKLGKSSFNKHMKGFNHYRVIIRFVVEEDGRIVDATAEEGTQPELDRIAENIIKKSGPWIPALQYNRPVKAYRRVPISFLVE